MPFLPGTLLWALVIFAAVMSITPGPNNIMLLTSGLNFGFRRTLPHMLGVALGFALMAALVGLGLAEIFTQIPVLYVVLKWLGAAYMVYLAIKIARSRSLKVGDAATGRPLTFLQAAAFQWINPKAWMIILSACATYTLPEHYVFGVAVITVILGVVTLPTIAIWVAFGATLRRALSNPAILRLFNWSMAILLIASLYPALRE